jgi:hypothetical protein
LLVVLLGTLSLGLSFAAKADMKWIEIPQRYSPACPTVCQNSDDYKFAVFAGIHKPTGKTFYVCATNYARTGWRVGYNIEWRKDVCFAQWHKMSGPASYGRHYLCLCTDKEMPPVTNEMLRR